MKDDFIKSARTSLTGPVLALSVLASGQAAHAENISIPPSPASSVPAVVDVPIIPVDIDLFHQRLKDEQPELVQKIREIQALFHDDLYPPSSVEIALANFLSQDSGAGAQAVKEILLEMSERSFNDQTIQTWIIAKHSIEMMSDEKLAQGILDDGPAALPLSVDQKNTTACLTFLSNDPDFFWSWIKKDMGVPDLFKLPEVFDSRLFVRDHEGAHCKDPNFYSQVSSATIESKVKAILKAEIHADMVSEDIHKDNTALLKTVAAYRIMESVISYVKTGDADHDSAFELWRTLKTIDPNDTFPTYLEPEDRKKAYASFSEICDNILVDDQFGDIADKLRKQSNPFADYLFVHIYLATRLGLEGGSFQEEPQAKIIAEEYVKAFNRFDALYQAGFQEKVTALVKEALVPSDDNTAPKQPNQTACPSVHTALVYKLCSFSSCSTFSFSNQYIPLTPDDLLIGAG